MVKSDVLHLLLILVYVCIHTGTIAASSRSVIEKLPGYPLTLPFYLETGYIELGEEDELLLFYYFIESERDPQSDPLLIWFTGGPGCSGFYALVYQIGPLAFDYKGLDGRFPSLVLNPHSWTQVASIIFVDSPVGAGFSYATTSNGYVSSDTKAAKDNYTFLRKGYIIGNPVTCEDRDHNEQIPYAHRMALISDEYFELAKSSCQGEYINPDPNNVQCLYALNLYKECTDHVNRLHILEPQCHFLEDRPVNLLVLSKQEILPFCRHFTYITCQIWANNETVQEALQVRKGTVNEWKRCNHSISYDKDVESVYEHHRILNEKGFQALVYSGDHDMGIPYISTLKWVRNINLTVDEKWRAWFVDGQVAGYTETYTKKGARVTFATVKGAEHTAPEYKPRECYVMVGRWLNTYPL